MLSPLAIFWYQIFLLPICSCIHFQIWFYFTWLHFFYTKGVVAWDITFITFMHYYKSRIFTHTLLATLSEVDQKIHQSVHFLPLAIQLALNFQEMHCSFIIISSISLVNNNKPKAWRFQQSLILLGSPLSIVHAITIHYHNLIAADNISYSIVQATN